MGMIVQFMHAQSTLKKSVWQGDVQGSSSEHEHGHWINGSPLHTVQYKFLFFEHE
jgi:hypothetical protein